MITLKRDRGYIVVDDWDEVVSMPGFVTDLDPAGNKLVDIRGRYNQKGPVRCGLANCHKPHNKGYIVVTDSGYLTNIGKDCGKREFDVEFEEQSRTFDREATAAANREILSSFSLRLDEIEDKIHRMKDGPNGASWANKNIRKLTVRNDEVPDTVVRLIADMVRAQRPVIFKKRIATENEIELIETAERRAVRRPHYIDEPVGEFNGLSVLYPVNDLRELLVRQLEDPIREFNELSIDDMSHVQLQHWAKFANNVDGTLSHLGESVETARLMLTRDNLEWLLDALDNEDDKSQFRNFTKSFD